jgi:hypothetical protein
MQKTTKEQMMAKFTHAVRIFLVASLIAGLSGCSEEEKKPTPPAASPAPLTVGGSVSGLEGGEVILQLNGADELKVKANGKFKFLKPLPKGTAYKVEVKTQPALPVKQSCKVGLNSGKIADKPVTNVDVTCTTNTYAIGGTVSGLAAKSKGVVIELKGGNEAKVTKNGNFLFPDTRLPDGSDFSIALKSSPAGQKCKIEAILEAPDADTINVVAVSCSKKGSK